MGRHSWLAVVVMLLLALGIVIVLTRDSSKPTTADLADVGKLQQTRQSEHSTGRQTKFTDDSAPGNEMQHANDEMPVPKRNSNITPDPIPIQQEPNLSQAESLIKDMASSRKFEGPDGTMWQARKLPNGWEYIAADGTVHQLSDKDSLIWNNGNPIILPFGAVHETRKYWIKKDGVRVRVDEGYGEWYHNQVVYLSDKIMNASDGQMRKHYRAEMDRFFEEHGRLQRWITRHGNGSLSE